MVQSLLSIRTIDSHTGGEPTRVVLEGTIPLEGATMLERREDFRRRFDHVRSGLINEPRGADVLVGAVLTKPVNEGSAAGIIFFNNVGYLGMCGHGAIGVVETLRYLNRITVGVHQFDTPVGTVTAELTRNGEVAIQNVTSYRFRDSVRVEVDGVGEVVGDIAYGGNWFFVIHEPTYEIALSLKEELTEIATRVHSALIEQGITGDDGHEIDHVELTGEASSSAAHSRNFVLCPGGAYDRSPCGTGTSAKLACLYEVGELRPGDVYVQESVTGSVFRGSVEPVEGGVSPRIVGRAHITADTVQHFSEDDPLRWGLPT